MVVMSVVWAMACDVAAQDNGLALFRYRWPPSRSLSSLLLLLSLELKARSKTRILLSFFVWVLKIILVIGFIFEDCIHRYFHYMYNDEDETNKIFLLLFPFLFSINR
ncbi:LOW QUALITY PROTEIN: hypothetical protein PanWU01x14_168730 [Parasponia andersonii]|uniref:Uncharacterized protein n=1 Tax=Parasponia andersonii TaxID=3476 RepID=A0A2P5CAN1_PARAD|nr:LOW QUALITY PROTEIN: hypothetical protein PanWU01x14_168730 [Parasponia andersonii]